MNNSEKEERDAWSKRETPNNRLQPTGKGREETESVNVCVRGRAPSRRLKRDVRAHRMTRIARSIAIFFLSALSTSAFPNDTLCNPSEEIVFSCQDQRGKTISVCASPFDQGGAKIAYRFGLAKKIELEIVADTSQKSPPVEHNSTLGSRASESFVRFRSGKYTYTVQNYWDGCPWPGQTHCKKYSMFTGVLVAKSDKLVARRICSSNNENEAIKIELLSRLRVPVSEKWPD